LFGWWNLAGRINRLKKVQNVSVVIERSDVQSALTESCVVDLEKRPPQYVLPDPD